MPTPEEIAAAALEPKKLENDEGKYEARSIDEMIEADKYEKAATASTKVPWGMSVARTKPGGTV